MLYSKSSQRQRVQWICFTITIAKIILPSTVQIEGSNPRTLDLFCVREDSYLSIESLFSLWCYWRCRRLHMAWRRRGNLLPCPEGEMLLRHFRHIIHNPIILLCRVRMGYWPRLHLYYSLRQRDAFCIPDPIAPIFLQSAVAILPHSSISIIP